MELNISIQEYSKSECVLFNSYSKTFSRYLSNHYPCTIKWKQYTFSSSEHLFYWLLLSNYPDIQKELYPLTDAKEVKRQGEHFIKKNNITEANDLSIAIPVLKFCLQLKYLQCPEFRKVLLSYPEKRLVEYAWWGDDEYGCVDINIENKGNWKVGNVRGKNITGCLIEEVRREGMSGTMRIEPPIKTTSLFGETIIDRDYLVRIDKDGGYRFVKPK